MSSVAPFPIIGGVFSKMSVELCALIRPGTQPMRSFPDQEGEPCSCSAKLASSRVQIYLVFSISVEF
jgi:hypothetical protein